MASETGTKSKRARRRDPHRIWYDFRGLAFAPAVVFIALCPFGECERHGIIFPLSGAMFLAGFALRVWCQMHLRYRLDVRKVLTTTGPYSYVRNPIYIGNTLMLLGACFLSEVLWFAPILLVWCVLVYRRVVKYEEAHLLKKYGEPYATYVRAVPRWLPSFGRAAPPLSNAGRFFVSSVLIEAPLLLYVVPFVIKDYVLSS